MTKSKLNKANVSYKFKSEILSQDNNDKLDDDGKILLWRLYLHKLSVAGFISRNSAKSWIYPKKELK